MASAAYDPGQWATFFATQVGAGAGLTGLLFVSVSINLQRILNVLSLRARAAKALMTLALMVLAGMSGLIPGQAARLLGYELLILGVLGWCCIVLMHWHALHRNPHVSAPVKVTLAVLTQTSTVPFVVAGTSLIIGAGGGLYWAAGSTMMALLSALADAWTLLVEILR